MARLEDIPAAEIGERLRIARTGAKKTQDDAAGVLSVSRPTLISIEKGQRKVKIEELERLGEFYGTSLNRLLASESLQLDLQGRFRKIGNDEQEANEAVTLLNRLASASYELERLLGIRFSPSYPPEQPITSGSIERQGEDAAVALRHRLGIGLSPISDIVSLLENELEIRVFVRGLPSKIAGIFAYDQTVGACILLNAKHPWERRALTAAHETGHFISNRSMVDMVELNEIGQSGDERFSNAFSYAFMMPPAAIRKRFHEIMESDKRFTPKHLILLAHNFHVSTEAMCFHLERLELLPRGTYESMRERGFNKEFVRGIVGDLAPGANVAPSNPRLANLVSSAYRRGLVSEGQLAAMLGIDRLEVRQMLDMFGNAEGDDFAVDLT